VCQRAADVDNGQAPGEVHGGGIAFDQVREGA